MPDYNWNGALLQNSARPKGEGSVYNINAPLPLTPRDPDFWSNPPTKAKAHRDTSSAVAPRAARPDNARRYRVLWSWDDLGYLAFAPLAWWQWPLYWLPMLIAHKQPVKRLNRVAYPYPAEAWEAVGQWALHRNDWHGYGYAKQQQQRRINDGDYAGHAERLEYERLEPEFWRQTPPRNVWLSLVNTEPSWVRATYRE